MANRCQVPQPLPTPARFSNKTKTTPPQSCTTSARMVTPYYHGEAAERYTVMSYIGQTLMRRAKGYAEVRYRDSPRPVTTTANKQATKTIGICDSSGSDSPGFLRCCCAQRLRHIPQAVSFITAPNLHHVQVPRFHSRKPWKKCNQSNQPRPAVPSSFRQRWS